MFLGGEIKKLGFGLMRLPMADAFLGKVSACLDCGACEAVCPQSIPIIEKLANAVKVLE